MNRPVTTARGERKGDFLGGKYLLEDCLGIGGMGEVYRATNVSLGRKVAIKVLSSKYVDREDDVLRFLREARAAAAVRHAHVVDVLDVARDDDGTPFIVQELLDGEDLEQYLRIRNGRLSCEEALEIMLPVADAVGAAHLQDVVHRDLKPANIFLARDRNKITPKVLDFGACLFPTMGDSAKAANEFIGTPHYMAPEQIDARESVDARSDVWALGVILWEILVGETPFEAPTPTEVLRLVRSRDVPPLRQRVPDAPPELELLVARCTARDRDARHSDATAVHQNMLEVRRKMRGGPSISRGETLTELPISEPKIAVLRAAKPTAPIGAKVPSLERAPRSTPMAMKMTLSDPGVLDSGFDDLDVSPRGLELDQASTPGAPLELAARPSSWPPSARSAADAVASMPPVLAPSQATRTSSVSSMPPVLAPSQATRTSSVSSMPPVLAPSQATRTSSISSMPPVLAPSQATRTSSIPPPLSPPPVPRLEEAPPLSKPDARPAGPRAILTSGEAFKPRKIEWTTADVARLTSLVTLPALAAFAVVRAVSAIGAPVGSALRGDSMLASGVLTVVALVAAAGICARSVLGQRSRFLYAAAAGSVLFGIVMIIVTASASEAAELGVPASMAGISTAVAPLAPFVLGLSALLNARAGWMDPYSKGEAIRSAATASAMLFLVLALGPLGVVHTPARAPVSHTTAGH